jgi:hypothetical protein
MSYQSPLHIIKSIAGDDAFVINDENLIRLRKRLLAELNLSGETTITINQRAYSKDEIIKTIDQLLGSRDLALHEFIYRHDFLLRYLEDDSLVLHPHVYRGFEAPEAIRPAFEPLITERIITQFRKGIGTRAFSHAKHAMEIMELLPEQLRSHAYEEAHRSLQTLNLFLYELENNLSTANKKDIQFLSFDSWKTFLNALPEAFGDDRYDLVNRSINMVVAYHKLQNHDKELVKDISTVLLDVSCDDEQALLIKNNHRVFSAGGGSSMSGTGLLKFIGILAIILINLLRVCEKNKHSYDPPSYNYQNNVIQNLRSNNEKAFNLVDELRIYKRIISERVQNPKNDFNFLFFDTLIAPPKDPFLYAFKSRQEEVNASWDKRLQVANTTPNDLIVLCFNAEKTNVSARYIPKDKTDTIAFGDRCRLIFYLGNTLMRARPNPYIDHDIPGYYECFKETGTWQASLLNTTYEIVPDQQKASKKSLYKLPLSFSFVLERKDTARFKNFRLINVYDR